MSGPTYREIRLVDINEPPAPIRQGISAEGIASLAESIRAHGQLQPIGVVVDGDRFTISYGHRRYLALEQLADRDARCLVFESTAEAMLGAQLAENVDREDMGPVDEAYWFAQLLEGLQTDTTRLAERLKMSRDYIEGRLELLAGDPAVLDALRRMDIGLGIARLLNTVEDAPHRGMLLDMCIKREAKVHTLTQWIAELRATGALAARAAAGEAGGSPASAPAAPLLRLTCCFCGSDQNAFLMEPDWIHNYCRDARERLLARALDASEVHRG